MRVPLRLALASLLAALLLAGCGAPAPEPVDTTTSRPGDNGRFQIAYTPEIVPVPINTLHAWTVHVETVNGEPVRGAEVVITGGMPAHNHGMPTRPQLTADLGNGDYRVEGMKFQMPGHWQVSIAVAAAEGSDTATFDLMLQ